MHVNFISGWRNCLVFCLFFFQTYRNLARTYKRTVFFFLPQFDTFFCFFLEWKIFSVFFSDGKYFSRPLLPKFCGAFLSFVRQIFRFFFGFMIFFSGRNFRIFQFTFWILTGKILFFFSLAKIFFLELNFAVFSSGTFFFSGCFQDFFHGQFQTSRAEYSFFFSGKKISTLRGHVLVFFLISLCSAVGTLWPNAAGWTLFHCGWFWLTFKKSNFIVCQSFRRLKVTTETSYFFRDFMEPYARMPPEKKYW